MQPLGEKLLDTREKARGDDQATSEHTDSTPIESISGTSIALISSHSTLFAALVPISRVQNLEA